MNNLSHYVKVYYLAFGESEGAAGDYYIHVYRDQLLVYGEFPRITFTYFRTDYPKWLMVRIRLGDKGVDAFSQDNEWEAITHPGEIQEAHMVPVTDPKCLEQVRSALVQGLTGEDSWEIVL